MIMMTIGESIDKISAFEGYYLQEQRTLRHDLQMTRYQRMHWEAVTTIMYHMYNIKTYHNPKPHQEYLYTAFKNQISVFHFSIY